MGVSLEVKLTVVKKEDDNDDDDDAIQKEGKEQDSKDKPKDNGLFKMTIDSSGKYSRKATWDDLRGFTGIEDLDGDKMADMIDEYQAINFPDAMEKPNHRPQKCWLHDTKEYTIFKDYGWNPIKLQLKPAAVDVKKHSTQQVVLEEFQLDYTTDLEKVLLEQGDKSVTSTLSKSKLAGHALALAMMESNSKLKTEFRGIESTTFVLGNNEKASELDPETGKEVWTDTKSLRALLKDKPLPKKTGKGVTRTVQVLAMESKLKARVYYKASFSGEVSTDHGEEKFDGQRYWNFPLKYLLQYNKIPNAAVIYEDVELHFFTDVKFAMENDDFIWSKDATGAWVKQYHNQDQK